MFAPKGSTADAEVGLLSGERGELESSWRPYHLHRWHCVVGLCVFGSVCVFAGQQMLHVGKGGSLTLLARVLSVSIGQQVLRIGDHGAFTFPPDVELVFMRHGQSRMNVPIDIMSVQTLDLCTTQPLAVPDPLCVGKPDELAKAEIIMQASSNAPPELKKAAELFWSTRQAFDAPLTPNGLLEAVGAHNATVGLQRQWLREHSSGQRHMTLATSNLIRAADTLFNGMQVLANSSAVDIYIVSALQELNGGSFNSDCVSVYLPLLLSKKPLGLDALAFWKQSANHRLEAYTDAGLIEKPWAPKGNAEGDLHWLEKRAPKLVSIGSDDANILVNHDLRITDAHIGQSEFLEGPPPPVHTVRLPGEYSRVNATVSGQERFPFFLRWLHASGSGPRRVVVAGHSTYFMSFISFALDHGAVDGKTCADYAHTRLKNAAVVRIKNGVCSCLFDGSSLEGDCTDPRI